MERLANGSFFTSWSWIGCFLQALNESERPRLIRAREGASTVGLALLGTNVDRRHYFLTSKVASLNATGNAITDEITIERNGILVRRDASDTAVREICRFLVDRLVDWEELRLDGMVGDWSWLGQDNPRVRVLERKRPCHFVDLQAIRTSGRGYLNTLSQNTRAQVRRSIKEYSKLGAIEVRAAETAREASNFLCGLKELHQDYWISRGEAGSFSNGFFNGFHSRLVADNFEQGSIQLIKVSVGELVLGYLYNFVYDGWVSNYQSGFNYGICEKHNRPGLVAHALAVELNLELGSRAYDFLAGDYQYKRMLGPSSETMSWIVLQRKLLKFRVRDHLRNLKHSIGGVQRMVGLDGSGGAHE